MKYRGFVPETASGPEPELVNGATNLNTKPKVTTDNVIWVPQYVTKQHYVGDGLDSSAARQSSRSPFSQRCLCLQNRKRWVPTTAAGEESRIPRGLLLSNGG